MCLLWCIKLLTALLLLVSGVWNAIAENNPERGKCGHFLCVHSAFTDCDVRLPLSAKTAGADGVALSSMSYVPKM